MSLENDYHFLAVKSKFPRIGLGIEIRWGTNELEPYILNLFRDTRGNTRQGFPKDVFDALHSLLFYHHKLYPSKRLTSTDPWDTTFGDIE